jgi:hypothetical protein
VCRDQCVHPLSFFCFCAFTPPLSLPFDATGPLSVLSSPPPPRCCLLFVYSQSAPPSIVAFTSALDGTPTLAAQALLHQYYPASHGTLVGAHDLFMKWHARRNLPIVVLLLHLCFILYAQSFF